MSSTVALVSANPNPETEGTLAIRPPRYRPAREAWNRVLDAGLSLLEEGGYGAFTISAICERANVAPRAIYDRADSKDALFLAVYEHGAARLRAEHAVFSDAKRWQQPTAEALASDAVRAVAGIFARNAAFLRSVVLISGVHPEIYRRGARDERDLSDRFTDVILHVREDIRRPDPEAAIRMAFHAVFSSLVLRVGWTQLASGTIDGEPFVAELITMVNRYLFAPETTAI